MPAANSELVVGMGLELDPRTHLGVLNEAEMIERVAGFIGLQDTVLRMSDYWYGVKMLRVVPYRLDARRENDKAFQEYAEHLLGAENVPSHLYEAPPFREPMTAEEVVGVAEGIRDARRKNDQYEKLSRLGKFGQNVLLILGRDSLAPSMGSTNRGELPDVITVKSEEGYLSEILVSQAAEEVYRSLPPGEWRRSGVRHLPPLRGVHA